MIVNMIKNKKILFILLGIVFVFVFFFILFYKSDDDKLENYILGIGFKKSGNLYEKKLSGVTMKQYYSLVSENVPVSSSYLYFDLNRYLLTEVNSHYTYELQYNFLGSYDFKDGSLSYRYEINDGVVSAMVKGEYLKESDSYSCDSVYLENASVGNSNIFSLICEQAQFRCRDFSYQAKTLITNPFILDKMKNGG